MGFHQHFLCLEFFRTCFGGVAALILPKRLGFRVALTKNVDETQWLSSTFFMLGFFKTGFCRVAALILPKRLGFRVALTQKC